MSAVTIGCLSCGRHVYVAAAESGFPAWLAVPEVPARLVCSILAREGERNDRTDRSI
jgi:hypothetical protein